ncbi:CLUMA_CG019159, isoform A [Clunio marinus]|uniref:CLUMA_CG019159, isoform A n=1 Tax=Clunio marinus TaxID=568069 RepID=A0A1J1J145_9DIPT|nr:CLUMA_CG019159, isoform A [Clunio marinus]
MDKHSGNKSVILNARRNLENILGDDWQKYLSHLRKFFRNGSKVEFDREIRSFLTNRQIYYHNSFLLAILNTADVTETTHQAPTPSTSKTVEIIEQQPPNPKRRRKNDEIVFQVHPMNEFVKSIDTDPTKSSTIRYAAQELFLPDNSLIYGRFLAGCWDNGLEFVDDQAIELIVLAVQMMLKNILSHCIRQKKHYKVTSDKKFYFDVGCELKDPTIRNTLTRQKIDSEIPTVERKPADDSICLSAHEDSSYNHRRNISLMDVYKTLRDRNVIPSHSIAMLSIERLTTLINL